MIDNPETMSIYDDGRYALDLSDGELWLFRWQPTFGHDYKGSWELIAVGDDAWPDDVPEAAHVIAAQYSEAWQ